MAIRKVGKDKTLIKKVTCKNCAIKLEYLQRDMLYRDPVSLPNDDVSGYYYILCPECKQEIKESREGLDYGHSQSRQR